MHKLNRWLAAFVGVAALSVVGGCPNLSLTEYIAGQTGSPFAFGDPSVDVVSPQSDLALTGGTPVEVNWSAVGRSRLSVVDVFLDVDQTPDNGNEIIAESNLAITETTVTLDTTSLEAGEYYIGVRVEEIGDLLAYDYAAGKIIVNQRPNLYFTSPRDNLRFDRTPLVTPSFDVAWSVSDPDSTLTVRIYLDPDETANGNEVLLRTSESQTGDSFTFDLPTTAYEAGTYRLLALVDDGVDTFAFYAPGSILLRARLAGYVDLRDLHLATSDVRGAVFEGFNPRDNAGSFVSSLGDLDNDGFTDFIILAQFAKPQYDANVSRTGAGEAYVVYGRSDRFSGKINLNSTGTLFRGDIFTGVPEVPDPIRPSRGISSFTLLSDWDSDGIREFAFGMPFTDSLAVSSIVSNDCPAPLDANGYFRTGAVVVVAGSSLRPDLGFPGRQIANLAEFGTLAHMPISCTACVDCPCDEGFYGPKAPTPLCGVTFFHQHLAGVGGTPNCGSIRLGCRFSSNDFDDQFGETVSTWDFDAIIISAPNRDPFVSVLNAPEELAGAGVLSVFFNDVRDGFYPWTNDQAPAANATFGYPGSVQSSGDRTLPHGGPYHYIIDDLRGYGFQNFTFLAAPGYTVDPDDGDPCSYVHDAHIGTPEYSVRFWTNQVGARLSNAHGLGDLNADGLLDLVIGAPFAEDGAGVCYLILGRLRDLIRSGELPLEELALPMNSSEPDQRRIFDGIRIVGNSGERLGQSQDNAGDFNNDGFADVVIGSPLLNNRAGGVAVFFGSREVINLTEEDIPFDALPSRGLGVIFVGEGEGDLAGAQVTGCGDVDGDGNDDILIAAPNRDVKLDIDLDGEIEIDRENCGVVYLVYGSPDLATRRSRLADGTMTEPGRLLLRDIGTEALPGAVFVGRNSNEFLGAGLGEQGDRSHGIAGGGDIDGDGFRDLLLSSVLASPRDRAAAGETYIIYGRGD